MSLSELKILLEHVADTRELVLDAAAPPAGELHAAWHAARREAGAAYEAWCCRGGREAYLVYRAAADRADAAQDTLVAPVLSA